VFPVSDSQQLETRSEIPQKESKFRSKKTVFFCYGSWGWVKRMARRSRSFGLVRILQTKIRLDTFLSDFVVKELCWDEHELSDTPAACHDGIKASLNEGKTTTNATITSQRP